MASIVKLDKIDIKILEILQFNAKITNAQLAIDIGLSPAPTLERVKKLEKEGYIKSYHAKLDTAKLNIGVTTFVMVSLKAHNKRHIERFVSEVTEIDEIIECHHITGSGDFILKVVSRDISTYQQLMLEKISNIDEVDNLQSLVILSTFKDNKVVPIPSIQ